MDIFFADDSRQNSPSRKGMGKLVAAGGIYFPDESVRPLEQRLRGVCEECGFPEGAEFKWSPGRELWMRDNLVGEDRSAFFAAALGAASELGAKATVVVVDCGYAKATGAETHEMDATQLLLERANGLFARNGSDGLVVADQPCGGRPDERAFLELCSRTLLEGTDYIRFDRIAVNVLSTPSRMVRCLQLADVVVSCTTQFVSGEDKHAPAIFGHIRAIMDAEGGRTGGYGLKLHPDGRYGNLYHWLVGDDTFWKHHAGIPLPWSGLLYGDNCDEP